MPTSTSQPKLSFFAKILAIVLSFGPGIFAIGYTIGTGSVTSMIVAGSRFGMQLLWVLLLSCFFSGVLIYVFGKFALVTGDTALYAFRKHLKFGKLLAILILISVSFGQWNSLMGILGISSNIIYEILALNYQFKLITLLASCVALVGPILGANPIQIQILSQVFNVFALPAVVLGIILLVHKKELMKGHRFSSWVIVSLYVAFFFSCVVSYNGVLGIMEM